MGIGYAKDMKAVKRHPALPIGRTAKVAFEIDALRARCSEAARLLISDEPVDGVQVEEAARLDEALARAHAILKSIVANIMLSRIARQRRRSKAR
jgi:hypothetical protein